MSKQELEDEILRQTKTLIAEFSEKEVVGIGLSEPLYHLLSYWNESILDLAYTHFNDWIRGALRQRMEQEMHLHVDTFSAVTLPGAGRAAFRRGKGRQQFLLRGAFKRYRLLHFLQWPRGFRGERRRR